MHSGRNRGNSGSALVGLRDYYRCVIEANPDGHLYECVVAAVHAMLREGVLSPGTRLPSLRALMQRLEISLSTGVRAYNALIDEGLVEVRPKSGYYVAAPRVQLLPKPRPVELDLRPVAADVAARTAGECMRQEPATLVPGALFPIKGVRQATSRALTSFGEAGTLELPPAGLPALRQLVAEHLDPAAESVHADHVAVINGLAGAFAFALEALRRRYGVIAVESPMLPSVLAQIGDAGFQVVEVPSDPVGGICMDALDHLIATTGIDGLVCMPSLGVPTGVVMNGQARKALVDLARAHDLTIIELNLLGELSSMDPNLQAMAAMDDTGHVINCGGLCHTLAPGYQFGWVASGQPLEARFSHVVGSIYTRKWQAPAVTQRSLVDLFRQRGFERYLGDLRRTLQFQYACVRKVIEDTFPAGTRATGADGAAGIWIQLPHGMSDAHVMPVAEETLADAIRVISGNAFSLQAAYGGYLFLLLQRPWDAGMEKMLTRFGTQLCAYRRARMHTLHGRIDRTGGEVALA